MSPDLIRISLGVDLFVVVFTSLYLTGFALLERRVPRSFFAEVMWEGLGFWPPKWLRFWRRSWLVGVGAGLVIFAVIALIGDWVVGLIFPLVLGVSLAYWILPHLAGIRIYANSERFHLVPAGIMFKFGYEQPVVNFRWENVVTWDDKGSCIYCVARDVGGFSRGFYLPVPPPDCKDRVEKWLKGSRDGEGHSAHQMDLRNPFATPLRGFAVGLFPSLVIMIGVWFLAGKPTGWPFAILGGLVLVDLSQIGISLWASKKGGQGRPGYFAFLTGTVLASAIAMLALLGYILRS